MSSHIDTFVCSGSSPTADFIVEDYWTIFLLRPLTPTASSWIDQNLSEDLLMFADGAVVEHRYIHEIVCAALVDGLEIQ
jgi:hypothetical protein